MYFILSWYLKSVRKVPFASLCLLPKYSSRSIGTPLLAASQAPEEKSGQALQLALSDHTHD
ncbi:hypothetical protein [Marinilabilia rubra]|uniref:hypothetical protein n=1 Tax=Marinilabilia rubra TaxID=2162893 RepID=UPI001304E635|nr:hypothetical protein [Marinilabilia rubra]